MMHFMLHGLMTPPLTTECGASSISNQREARRLLLRRLHHKRRSSSTTQRENSRNFTVVEYMRTQLQ
jgi:hypothetical protein